MEREVYLRLARSIRNHPGFAAAAQIYIDEFIAWRESLGPLNRVIGNAARLRIMENVIYLHFAKLREGGHGASFERLAQLSGATDEIGVRAVRTTLRLALTAGLVIAARDPADGRLRVYQPTPALLSQSRAYWALYFRPLERVFQGLNVSDRLRNDPEFHVESSAALGRAYLNAVGGRLRAGSPYRDIVQLEGALPIFAAVVDCFWRGRPLPPAAELSRRFFVSQSQARAVVKAAEAVKLVQVGARGRLLDAAPLAEVYFEAHARNLAFAALHVFGVRPWAKI